MADIRGLEDTTLLQQQPGKLVPPVSSDGATEVAALRQELAEMKVMMLQQQRESRTSPHVRYLRHAWFLRLLDST